jgi:valyl-tRNA synthetase
MAEVLDESLRLLHPYTPFVTEEIWGHLKSACSANPGVYRPQGDWEPALIIARWPEPTPADPDGVLAQRDFGLLMDIVRAIRNIRSERGVEPSRRIAATVAAGESLSLLEGQISWMAALARLDPAKVALTVSLDSTPDNAVPLVVGGIEVLLPLAAMFDVEAERARIERELDQAEIQIARLSALLAGPFSERAPGEVIAKERARLDELKTTKEKLTGQLNAL